MEATTTSDSSRDIDETALLLAARAGDRVAFGDLMRTYQRRAYAIAYSYVGNREDALELAQDAFIRAFRAMDRFDTSQAFYPWLYRIVKNLSLNHLKRRQRRKETSLDAMMEQGFDLRDTQACPESALHRADMRQQMLRALEMLPPEQQEILRLRHFLELRYREIAACLEIPQGTVMSRLYNARKALRAALELLECGEALEDTSAGDE